MHKISATLVRRAGANLAALAVGGVAARATWAHIVHVGTKYGEGMAAFLPVSIDGMMIAGVLMAADAKAAGRPISPWARVATWTGGVLSIAAQIESGRERGWVAALIATVFSLTLIITVEAVTWQRKATRQPVAVTAGGTAGPIPRVPVQTGPTLAPVTLSAQRTAPHPVAGHRPAPTPRRQSISPLTGQVLVPRPRETASANTAA